MNPCISIILPVYNRATILEECVQSVLNQSFRDFEILLIDDGSTDDTLALCHSLALRDSRIHIFETTHVGVSAARNIGIDAALGEYLFFLDSDDVIHPQLLEALVNGMTQHQADMAGSVVVNVRQSRWELVSQRIQEDPGPGITSFHSNSDTLGALFQGNTPFNLIGGVMMRRSLIGQTRFRTDLFIGEDYYFIYENLIKGPDTVFLSQKWYYARIHPHNSSNNFTYEAFWSRFYRRELVWKQEEAFGRTENANREKQSAFNCFLRCTLYNVPGSETSQQIRKTMARYRKILFPALSPAKRIYYYVAMYCPHLHIKIYPFWKKLRKH